MCRWQIPVVFSWSCERGAKLVFWDCRPGVVWIRSQCLWTHAAQYTSFPHWGWWQPAVYSAQIKTQSKRFFFPPANYKLNGRFNRFEYVDLAKKKHNSIFLKYYFVKLQYCSFSLGLVQESESQVEEAGKEPASRALQKRLRPAVQWTHAALRGHVPQLHVQQLGRQGPDAGLVINQKLPLLQLHERQPPVLANHVLAGAQLHILHDLRHGALSRDRRAGLQPQQPQ